MLLRSSSSPILGAANSSHADVTKESELAHISHGACHPPSPSCHSPVPLTRSNSWNSFPHTSLVDSSRKTIREHEGDPSSQSWLRGAQSEDVASHYSGSASACAASSLMSSVVDESESASENISCRHQWAKRVSFQSRSSAIYKQDFIVEESESLESGSENGDQGIAECFEENSALTERHTALASADVRNTRLSNSRSPTLESVLIPEAGREFLLDDGEIYTSLSADANGSPVACNSRGCRPLTKLELEKLGILSIPSGLGTGTRGIYRRVGGWNGGAGYSWPDANGTDAHYKNLLQADSQNPLLLRNYAKYLSEVKGDGKRSEEYLERAILASPGDGEVLAQYAKLQWDLHRDEERAEAYYDQAVQAAPDDCYVLASYASFLWEAEDDEEVVPSSSPLHAALHGASSSSASLMASA